VKIELGPWRRVERGQLGDLVAEQTSAPGLRIYQRKVSDGHLSVMAACEKPPHWDAPLWHLSISHRTNEHPPEPGRYPTWDEIKEARYRFLPPDITVAMILPPPGEYVNVHDTCFHLWQVPDGVLPR
jgi:hypothetical protein